MVRALMILLLAVQAGTCFAQQASLKIEFDKPGEIPLERQMILLTIKGSYDFRITLQELVLPKMADFEWVQLDRDDWRDESDGGKFNLTMRRRMALFPVRAGRLRIPPIVHKLEFLNASGTRETLDIASEAVSLTVRPPLGKPGDFWLPVSALEYSDEWKHNPADLKDGELAERTVTIKALGATPQMLPKQPAMREPWLVTFSEPEERHQELTRLGPLTTIVWRWSFHPVRGEPGVLSDVAIPYFDTSEHIAKHIVLAATPFGYKSFAAAKLTGWQAGFSGFWLAPLCFVAGMALSLLALLVGRRASGRLWTRIRAAWQTHRLQGQIRKAARNEDWRSLRRNSQDYLQMLGLGEDEICRELVPVDAVVFGGGKPAADKLKAFARTLSRKNRVAACKNAAPRERVSCQQA